MNANDVLNSSYKMIADALDHLNPASRESISILERIARLAVKGAEKANAQLADKKPPDYSFDINRYIPQGVKPVEKKEEKKPELKGEIQKEKKRKRKYKWP